METPRNSQPSRKHAADSKRQDGNVIVPGTEYSSPLSDVSKQDDKTKGNFAETATDKDGNTIKK